MNLVSRVRTFLRASGSDLRSCNEAIARIEKERAALTAAIPHTDDLVAWLGANIDQHAEYFTERMAAYLSDERLAKRGWPEVEAMRGGFPVFKVPDVPASSEGKVLAPTESRAGFQSDPLNARALVALLAPVLKEQLRPLVLRLMPSSARGIRKADRDRQLREIDERLEALYKQRDELHAMARALVEVVEGR